MSNKIDEEVNDEVIENINYEEKVKELEDRVAKLEKIEHKRKIKNIIVLSIYGVIFLVMIVFMSVIYTRLKPYVEQLKSLKNIGSSLKSDSIVDGSDGLDGFGDFGGFGGLEDYFNNFFN